LEPTTIEEKIPMSDELLQANAGPLLRAPAHAGLHRVLQAAEKNTPSLSYIEAYDRVNRAVTDLGGNVSVAEALQSAGVSDLGAVAEDLKTLERADAAKEQVHRKVMQVHQLDAGAPGAAPAGAGLPRIDANTYSEVMSAHPVHWARLHEARTLPGGADYEGPKGPDRFATYDRRAAEAGVDLVGGMRQRATVQAARRQAASAVQKLDAALEKGKTPAERRRLLDQAATEGLRQLDAQAPAPAPRQAPASDRLRMLDGESPQELALRMQALIDAGDA
jgi:hypothetical protein